MRDRLELPIEFDAGIQAYRYTTQVNAFPTVNVTEGELLALLVAQRALEQYRGTPFHHQLEVAFGKLAGGLRDKISFSPADELRAVSFKNIGLGKTDLAVFNALSAAVLRHEEVTFNYRKSGEKQSAPRHVRPAPAALLAALVTALRRIHRAAPRAFDEAVTPRLPSAVLRELARAATASY